MNNNRAFANEAGPQLKTRPMAAVAILAGGLIVLALGIAGSISVGAADISLSTVWEAIFHFDANVNQHQIIQELRLPRALSGALVGASFAAAGAIMQGMTRNPLADSGLLGLNAGAGLALALCFAIVPSLPFSSLMLYSFLGAAVGAGMVFGIGSMARGGLTPVRLTIAGAAVSALLIALAEGVALYFRIGQDLAFWYAGGLAGTQWLQVKMTFPWIAGGLAAAIILSRSVTLLSLGEEVATGLGQRTTAVKIACMLVVLVLAGAAVSTAGPIAFIGLIIPHVARMFVGVDYRWIIPCSAVLGALLMVFADIAARMINPPYETPIGALIALIGVPFFLYLAQKEKRVFS
ncbi:FecCD family ABC transporter permease [Paenibacillus abyssi]|uniref:Ferrichrome ABC transporter permease n=1 Tax=Paenibacillus abyssi TaxID=1340531 RepID=A0A917D226_9BACL|nr:iron ABC transporter permease [Paenibacillus abyssi]GGG08386.1 ferrichrome ABC transporter permease [Paenibacillus abyssi]